MTERLELVTELTRNNNNGQSICGIIWLTKCRLFSSSFLLRIFSIRSSKSKVSCLVRDIASIFMTYYRYIRPFGKTKIPHFIALVGAVTPEFYCPYHGLEGLEHGLEYGHDFRLRFSFRVRTISLGPNWCELFGRGVFAKDYDVVTVCLCEHNRITCFPCANMYLR